MLASVSLRPRKMSSIAENPILDTEEGPTRGVSTSAPGMELLRLPRVPEAEREADSGAAGGWRVGDRVSKDRRTEEEKPDRLDKVPPTTWRVSESRPRPAPAEDTEGGKRTGLS